jgi:hypothetical protein
VPRIRRARVRQSEIGSLATPRRQIAERAGAESEGDLGPDEAPSTEIASVASLAI